MSYATGQNVGLAKKARLVPVRYTTRSGFAPESVIFACVSIANDLIGKGQNTGVVNMSFGSDSTGVTSVKILFQVLRKSYRFLDSALLSPCC